MRDNVKTRAAQLEKFEIWRNHNADTLSLSLQFQISLIEQLFLSENH